MALVVFSTKLDLEVLEICSYIHVKELDLTERFCSAGSKDGCIKLWKISKNYTVLQPLYSIPMVGRFQVIFTWKCHVWFQKIFRGLGWWRGGVKGYFCLTWRGIRVIFEVNLLHACEFKKIEFWKEVWNPLPRICVWKYNNCYWTLIVLLCYIHVVRDTQQHASNGCFITYI